MITGDFVNGLHLMVGLSTDSKPTVTSENSFFLEEDSGDCYYYSEGQWTQAGDDVRMFIASIIGGGGMSKFTVTFTLNGLIMESDKTLDQVKAAKAAGMYVEGVYDGMYCPLSELKDNFATFRMIVETPSPALNVIKLFSGMVLPESIPLATEQGE